MKRMSKEIFDKCNTIDDVVELMNTTVDGHKTNRVSEGYKSRLDALKEHINKIVPELTLEQVLFIDEYSTKIKEIYNWYGIHDLLTLIEFEIEKDKLNGKSI